MLQRFFLGFFSVFRFGSIPSEINKTAYCPEEYIDLVEKDLYLSYEKLKNNHEGKKEFF